MEYFAILFVRLKFDPNVSAQEQCLIAKQRKFRLIQEDHIQSTLVISNSKGPSEILRDIRTSTYQICRIEN